MLEGLLRAGFSNPSALLLGRLIGSSGFGGFPPCPRVRYRGGGKAMIEMIKEKKLQNVPFNHICRDEVAENKLKTMVDILKSIQKEFERDPSGPKPVYEPLKKER